MGKLTETEIKQLILTPEQKPVLMNDGQGLYVRKYASGKAVFVFRFKQGSSGDKWMKLGFFGPTPGLSLKQAREKAIQLSLRVDSGELLNDDREKEKTAIKLLSTGISVVSKEQRSLDWLFKCYLTSVIDKYKDRGEAIKRQYELHIRPALGKRLAEQIETHELSALLRKVRKKGNASMPGRILRLINNMYRFGRVELKLKSDPGKDLRRKDFADDKVGHRYLTETELKTFFEKLEKSSLGIRSKAFFRLQLATGVRAGELENAAWSDVDLTSKLWTIPPDKTKNQTPHTVKISDYAKRQFMVLWELRDTSNPFIFPSDLGPKPVFRSTFAKQLNDRQHYESDPQRTRKKRTTLHTEMNLPRGRYRPHDLRRTFSTIAAEKSKNQPLVEMMLNHQSGTGIVKVYQKAVWFEAMAEVWELMGKYLEELDCQQLKTHELMTESTNEEPDMAEINPQNFERRPEVNYYETVESRLDQTEFELNEEKFKEFSDLINLAPETNLELENLLKKKSVW